MRAFSVLLVALTLAHCQRADRADVTVLEEEGVRTFETLSFGCAVRTRVTGDARPALRFEDECAAPDAAARGFAAILGEILRERPVTALDALTVCRSSFKAGWSERMALASEASPAWERARRRTLRPETERIYVDLFNRGDLARALSAVFEPYGARLSLYAATGVQTSTARLLPAAKTHPALLKSKHKVLIDADCLTFNFLPYAAPR